jgi:hypothetical protein
LALFSTLLGLLAVCFPFGLYCLIIARLNSRSHPVMIWGVWDFGGVLLAVSGLLFVIGPWLMRGFGSPWRDVWLQINYPSLRGYTDSALHFPGPPRQLAWISMWYLYFGLVACLAIFLLWRRRRVTAVYNVGPSDLTDALALTLDRLGLQWGRAGQRVLIDAQPAIMTSQHRSARPTAVLAAIVQNAAAPVTTCRELARRTSVNVAATLELSSFPAMRHVTLSWRSGEDTLRQEVESELAKALSQIRTKSNSVALWLRTLAAVLFMTLFCLSIYVQLSRVRIDGF